MRRSRRRPSRNSTRCPRRGNRYPRSHALRGNARSATLCVVPACRAMMQSAGPDARRTRRRAAGLALPRRAWERGMGSRMAIVYVNDKPVDIGTDRLNLVQAAQRGGVFIPHYCWHPALSVVASCRMCLVEVGEKKPDGTVTMQPKVVPACQTPAKDGTIVRTTTDRARHAQMQTLEGILLNHPLDCPVCDK